MPRPFLVVEIRAFRIAPEPQLFWKVERFLRIMRPMMFKQSILLRSLALAALVSMVAGCSGFGGGAKPEDPRTVNPTNVRKMGGGKVFGEDALTFGGAAKRPTADGGGGIGVNSFLWRASLDTVVFMPVNSADPFGGVIITDWHTPAGAPSDERFKLNIYILGRALRADGVRVAVFKQVRDANGVWADAAVSKEAATKVEDAILMKARQLRNETLEQ